MLLIRMTVCVLALGVPLASALEDPTRPSDFRRAVSEPSQARSYSLESILIGPSRRAAVIDGITRIEGERFGGVRLVNIYPDKVVLSDQGQARVLRWKMPTKVRVSR
ncbi:MAG: hypothetical protein KGY54_07995 [Oleiphilaceae bacterium]|nr:hypothetical protein [Oleiphilaceae bacterium]